MFKSKKWIINEVSQDRVAQVADKFGISHLIAKIILLRGYEENKEIENFLNFNNACFYDPYLLHDMQKAVDYIKSSVKLNKKIAVYGDYDVDGITSTYILYDYLTSIGANVIYYIPFRADEGYGINNTAIDTLKSEGVELIITVDVGITAVDEIKYAYSQGIDVIVTDHHTLKDTLPSCHAIINPKIPGDYPFDSLAGVGVAYKLIYALSGCDEEIAKKYSSMAALGTIADMVPLTDENRYIVHKGLIELNNTTNQGLKALIEISGISGKEITSSSVGYILAPRLNAAGRIASATQSIKLLLENDKTNALKLAMELDSDNQFRQQEEQKILQEAMEIINKNKLYDDEVIVVAAKNWHHGIIGIVSSKITETYYKPSTVISINDDGTAKASGRSISGFNLFNALSHCSEYLQKFGGHELAAGFTVYTDKIDDFRIKINEYAKNIITEEISTPKLHIDAVISADDISTDNISMLKMLEPCGIGNRSPMFCIKDVCIKNIRYPNMGKHAFLSLQDGNKTIEAPAFNMASNLKDYGCGDKISVAGSLGTNTYRGITTAQLLIKDVHQSDLITINKPVLKDIFNVIKFNIESNQNTITASSIRTKCNNRYTINQIKTALTIYNELKIIDMTTDDSNTVTIFKGVNYNTKNTLKDSPTYRHFCNEG